MSTSHLSKFLPPDGGRSFAPPRRHLIRACLAHVRTRTRGNGIGSVADTTRDLYGDDAATLALVQRAAVSPASTTGWGAETAGKAVLDFVLNLPGSAASKLFAAGLDVNMTGRNEIKVPRLAGTLPNFGFVDEGQPAPAAMFLFVDAAMPAPSKMMVLAGFTRETAESAAAEAVVGTVLREATARSLDGALFSNAAASAIRPAGLLAGVTPLSPTAGGTGPDAARNVMLADLQALCGAVAAAGGIDIAVVAGTSAATAIKLRLPDFAYPVWPSLALAADTVIAVDAATFMTGFSPEPVIESSRDATIHYEDAAPQPIAVPDGADADTAAEVAAPVRSAFQTDTIVLRLILATSWAMREPGRIAVINGATWC